VILAPKRERIEKPRSRVVEPLHLDLAQNLFHHQHPTAYYSVTRRFALHYLSLTADYTAEKL
jgi:hypothetical protein